MLKTGGKDRAFLHTAVAYGGGVVWACTSSPALPPQPHPHPPTSWAGEPGVVRPGGDGEGEARGVVGHVEEVGLAGGGRGGGWGSGWAGWQRRMAMASRAVCVWGGRRTAASVTARGSSGRPRHTPTVPPRLPPPRAAAEQAVAKAPGDAKGAFATQLLLPLLQLLPRHDCDSQAADLHRCQPPTTNSPPPPGQTSGALT